MKIFTTIFAVFLFRSVLAAEGDNIVINLGEYSEQLQVIELNDTVSSSRNKVITSILSFPFPFGLVGAHRVFLGTKPYIPIIYIATLGGCFGILPMIDFIVILTKKDMESFNNNGKVFMWLK